MQALTLERWRAEPKAVVAEIFGPGGAAAAILGPRFQANVDQIAYAGVVAETIRRGADALSITPVQAGTGTGKTLAYLVPALIECALTGERVRIATYTLLLQTQIVAQEGPAAAAIVQAITGLPGIAVAATNSRSQFVCPTKLGRYIASLRDDGAIDDAALLTDLKAYAEKAIEDAVALGAKETESRSALREDADLLTQLRHDFVASGRGLIEVWVDDDPSRRRAVDQTPRAAIAIDADSDALSQVPWRLHRDELSRARCVVTTLATLLIDMQTFGSLSHAFADPFAVTIVDEADRLDDAAHNVFSRRLSLGALATSLRDLVSTLASTSSPVAPERAALCSDLGDAALAVDEIREAIPQAVDGRDAVLTPRHSFLAPLRALESALPPLVSRFIAMADADDRDLGLRILRLNTALRLVLSTIDGDKRAGIPAVDLSPVRQDPCLTIVPYRGSRLVSRLWSLSSAMSRSVVFTSATLAVPTASQPSMRDFLDMAGIRPSSNGLNGDLMQIIEPRRFGDASFVFASPRNAAPNQDGDERLRQSPAWIAQTAEAILTAAARPAASGNCRVLTLTTSFSDTEALNETLADALADRLVRRTPGEPLAVALAKYRARPDAVLIAPGAWEGVDLPGMIDHLIIPRAPYAPPSPANKRLSAVFTWIEDGQVNASQAMSRLLRKMRQAIGRGVRSMSDAPTIWLIDPRFGLPEALQRRLLLQGVLPHPQARPEFLRCIPDRFRLAVARAELFESTCAAPAPKAPARERKKKVAADG